MHSRTCPSCGTPLGAGVLEGLCPRCLALGDSCPARVSGHEINALIGGDPPSPDVARRGRADDADASPTAAAPRNWLDQLAVPQVPGYEIDRELKRGGQGIVYVAVQRGTRRKVAIKLLLEGALASESARRRFMDEVELIARLRHPNIIAIFDSGCTPDGHLFYAMDYFRGVPFTQYVRDKKPALAQVLELFAATCEAVNHAHQNAVIHRDLKPSNILVDANGSVRVLDFGLAKRLIDLARPAATITGDVVGSFPYMSPNRRAATPTRSTRAPTSIRWAWCSMRP